jgi:sulfur-oxidizing protein SoxX
MLRMVHFVICCVVLAFVSCAPPEKSPAGFRLPDGDPVAGRADFVALKCNACHRVKGIELEPPVAEPPVPVVLGGVVDYQPTDGRFVTSIINPSHKLAPGFPEELIKSGNESRMADYSDVMTVRELVDLVAFLHTLYEYSPPPVH